MCIRDSLKGAQGVTDMDIGDPGDCHDGAHGCSLYRYLAQAVKFIELAHLHALLLLRLVVVDDEYLLACLLYTSGIFFADGLCGNFPEQARKRCIRLQCGKKPSVRQRNLSVGLHLKQTRPAGDDLIHPSEIRVQFYRENRKFGMIAYVVNRIRHPPAILRHTIVSGNKKEKR